MSLLSLFLSFALIYCIAGLFVTICYEFQGLLDKIVDEALSDMCKKDIQTDVLLSSMGEKEKKSFLNKMIMILCVVIVILWPLYLLHLFSGK